MGCFKKRNPSPGPIYEIPLHPATPQWLRGTRYERHRLKFLISGGIILTILLISSILIIVLTRFINKDGTSPTTKREVSTSSPRTMSENSQELVYRWNSTDVIEKNVFQERFKTMIEQNKTDVEIKSLYEFCVDQESLEKHGIESLRKAIRNMGGWELMNIASDDGPCHHKSFCFRNNTKENLRQHLISAWVVPCPSNSTYCIQFSSEFKMEREEQCHIIYDSIEDPLCKNMGHVARTLLVNAPDINEQCLILKNRTREFCRWMSRSWPSQNELITIDKYKKYYHLGEPSIRNTISEIKEISRGTVVYLQDSMVVLRCFQRFGSQYGMPENNRLTIGMWEFLNSLRFFLPKQFRGNLSHPVPLKKLKDFKDQDRWKGCVDEILSAYPSTSMTLYRTEYYDSKTQENVNKIFDNVKSGFIRVFAKMNWMDDNTRSGAGRKLEAISIYTPKPQKDIVGNPTIDKEDPIKTVLSLKYLKLVRNYSYLGERFDWEDEEFLKIDKNHPSPHYIAGLNKLYLPVETLHMYFEKKRPDHMNYVALGFMIARQIAYGFNKEGFGIGENGHSKKWITPESETRYSKAVDCFISKTLNYTTNLLDQGERSNVDKIVADYMGLRATHAAYEISIERNNNPQLPRSTYNNQQIFWTAAGKLFASNDTVGSLLISHLNQPHCDSKLCPKKICSFD